MQARIAGRGAVMVMLVTAIFAAPAHALHDHLKCFKMLDPLALRGVVDIDAAPVATPAGCKLGKGRYYCTPASKTVFNSNRQTFPFSGRELSDGRICYNLRCSKPNPADQTADDQFGSRTVSKLKPRLLCTPAVKGPPLDTQDGLDDVACYKIKDPSGLRAVVGLEVPGFNYSSCDVRPGKLLCVPASTTIQSINVSPLLDIGGTTPDDAHVCYSMHCSDARVNPQIISDRFGSRTATNFTARLMCTPAFIGTSVTTTTSTSVPGSTSTSTTFPSGTDQALVCQRAIESGGISYATEMIDAVRDCANPGSGSLSTCLSSAGVAQRMQTAWTQWHDVADPPCAGLNVRTKLGYAEKCGAAPSLCTAPVTDAHSAIDCLTCRFQESIKAAGTLFYANQSTNHTYETCSQALGNGTLDLLEDTLQNAHDCIQQSGQVSIAACFTPGSDAWRTQVESACMTVNPFTQMGYQQTCTGRFPVAPDSYVSTDPPCTMNVDGFTDTVRDNDLLDCFSCRAEEAVLQVARDMYGSNLCCIGGVCNKVLTRFSCREAGGTPVRYHVESMPISVAGPHGLDIAPDGSLLVADSGNNRALRVSPSNAVTVLGNPLSFPVGIAGDAAGNVYLVNRCSETVVKIAPGGATSIVAGTGVAGHSGDGGPATAARIVAPDGLALDPAGNIYFTESGFLNYVCGALSGAGERLRMIDTNGIIHTLAGAGLGVSGEGGLAANALLSLPYGLRLTPSGDILMGEAVGQRILRISGGILTRVAGTPPLSPIGGHSGYSGPAARARFYQNCGVAEDADGNVVIAPMENNRVALVDSLGSVIAIAGTGEQSFGTAGDGGPAMFATIGLPEDIVVGFDGKIYVSDLEVSRIRVLTREPF